MNTDAQLAPLLEEGWIGRLKLKNRLIQAAMHTRFASHFGEVTDQLIAYHEERARGGVALIILENTAVDWEVGRAAGNPVRIDDDIFISGLSDLTSAVHAEGALIAAQLHHAGRQNSAANTEGHVGAVGPSPVMSQAIGEVPRDLDASEIPKIVDQFAQAARRAVDAGFDMVEIHGSHGYLLTQFLSAESNLRTDEYGGSFENRARMPLEVVQAVREAVGPDFSLSYRISIEERTAAGMPIEEGIRFCQLIEPYIDVFNVTVGTYDSMQWIFTMYGVEPGVLLPVAAKVKEAVNKPVIGISRLGWSLDKAADAVAAGNLDFVAMARTQLADPHLVSKTIAGHTQRIRRCIACNECVGGFLFNGWRVHCVMNPELGREYQLHRLLAPSRDPHDVVVVGGGPAGCEAARVAAIRGHNVRLVERSDRLGGQLRAASAPSFKRREMESFVEYYEAELEHLGVEVILGTELGEDEVASLGARTLILATGPVASVPNNGFVHFVRKMERREPLDGNVLVRGANEAAITAAVFLAESGNRTVLELNDQDFGYDMNPLAAGHTAEIAEGLGVEILDKVDDWDGVVLEVPNWTLDETEWKIQDDIRILDARTGSGRLFEATQRGFHAGTKV